MSSRRVAYLLVMALVLALLAGGCGVSTKNAEKQGTVTVTTTTASTATKRLPPRPSGQIDVDGSTQGSLSAAVAPLVTGVRVNVGDSGADAAFQELCNGRIDAVDSARPINPGEFSQCARNGIQVVQFQVASDATVIVTQNGYDVGVDCLTLGLVNAIFRKGSTIVNWAQVHGFNIPLRTTGPNVHGNGFDFFSQYALGTTSGTLAAFRDDYVAEPSDDLVRLNITGREGDIKNAQYKAKADADYAKLQAAIAQKRAYIQQLKQQIASSSGATKAAAENNLTIAQKQLDALLRDLPAALAFRNRADLAAARVNAAHQYVGILRFSYYELYEEQLRPIEIETGTTARHNCIFPSLDTVTNATFPLARQLLITIPVSELKRPEMQNFLRTYLNRAQALATDNRLVPLPDQVVARQLGWISNPATAPRVYYAPGTRNPTSAIPQVPDSSIPAAPSSSSGATSGTSTSATTTTTTTATGTVTEPTGGASVTTTTSGAGGEATSPPYGSGG